ncbi:unnamed protein product [Lepidochelys kempii]
MKMKTLKPSKHCSSYPTQPTAFSAGLHHTQPEGSRAMADDYAKRLQSCTQEAANSTETAEEKETLQLQDPVNTMSNTEPNIKRIKLPKSNWKEGVCLEICNRMGVGCSHGQIAAAVIKEEEKTTYRFCQGLGKAQPPPIHVGTGTWGNLQLGRASSPSFSRRLCLQLHR